TPIGLGLGLVRPARGARFAERRRRIERACDLLRAHSLTPNEAAAHGIHLNRDGVRRTALDLLSRSDIDVARLAAVWPELGAIDATTAESVETDARYSVYLERQRREFEEIRRDEQVVIPEGVDYSSLPGLSIELRQKLTARRP